MSTSKSFTLDDIRSAAEAKYGSTTIDGVKLLNPLRLSSDKRNALKEITGRLKGDDAENVDQAEIFRDAIRTVAEYEPAANDLLSRVGDDLAVLVMLFNKYIEGTQAGEASPSQD